MQTSDPSSSELLIPIPIADPIADLIADLIDKPRERLWRCGTASIGDTELIALVLGTGVRDHPVLAVAAELVSSLGGVAALSRASPHELAQIRGVGVARAARLAAAFELGRRAVELVHHRRSLGSADVRGRLLDIVEVARGSLAHVEVHPREVFRPLVRMAAAGGVVVHNHPAGDLCPSHEDRELTRQLREVGRVLGIPIIDHIIVGDHAFRSLAEWMGTDF
jgi:DNA repair protein RadC